PHPDSLLLLRPEGTLPPLFILHGAGGILTNCDHLVRALPAAMPVFGLQSRALVDPQGERPTLSAMVRDYAQLIHERQPSGAIRLAGYSAGGLVAIATARELEKMGREVSFIGLLDTAVRLLDPEEERLPILREHIEGMYRYLAIDLALTEPLPEDEVGPIMQGIAENVLNLPQAERIQTTLDWLTGKASFPAEKFDAMARNYLGTFSIHWDFISQLQLDPVKARMHVWTAVAPGEAAPPLPSQLRALTPHKITSTAIVGSHYDIMSPPTVTTLARQVARAMSRA
ncbi:MAG: hypothetical protein JNG86_14830, partial [Verrucomicrobiaceae bacterium]|nr:hypothetical protein [Verrucomicrobiaceae bacterium]